MIAAEISTVKHRQHHSRRSSNAIAYARLPDQVLHIVYGGTAGVGIKSGGFFPSGLNGNISATTT